MTKELIQLYKEIQNCDSCPKSQWNSKHKEDGWGETGGILFIGQNPAWSSLGKPEGGSTFDKSLKKLLLKSEISDGDYFFTNVIKVPPVNERLQFTTDEICHLGSHLLKEIPLIKPIVIVGLGTFACNWLKTYSHPYRYYLWHPSAVHYKVVSEDQYVVRLKEIEQQFRTLKVEKETGLI